MSDTPDIRPEEGTGEEKSPCRLGLISMLLLLLIAAVVYYFYLRRHDPGFRPWNIVQRAPAGDPVSLGRRVTFVSISPLTSPYGKGSDGYCGGIQSTVYTKIGSKAVPASGKLDVLLYAYDKRAPEGKGRQVCKWIGIALPGEAKWGRWPLGGWALALTWDKHPDAPVVCVEAIYTNPAGRMLTASQGPIEIAGM